MRGVLRNSPIFLLCVFGCAAPGALRDTGDPGESGVPLASLGRSIEPLRSHFNAHADKDRVVAILSPT